MSPSNEIRARITKHPETSVCTFHAVSGPKLVGAYCSAFTVDGHTLELSGVGPRSPKDGSVPGGPTFDPEGNKLVYDFRVQCKSVFDNVRLILTDCGWRWDHIVSVNALLIDLQQDFPVFNEMWRAAFKDNPIEPIRTTYQVARLPTPIAIELVVKAYK